MHQSGEDSSSFSEFVAVAERVISPAMRSFRLWCILGIIGSVTASVGMAVGYMKWSLSHYEATADRYETGLDRLVNEISRTMVANTEALKASISANTDQITLLRQDVTDSWAPGAGRPSSAFTLEDIKGVVQDALGEGHILTDQSSD